MGYPTTNNIRKQIGINASGPEINAAADVSTRLVEPGDVDSYTVLAADSGKVFSMTQVTGDIAITLPTPATGLEYTFIMGSATAEGDDWVFTATSDFIGGLTQIDTDGTAAAVISDGSSKNTMTIVAPLAGTRVHLISDGTDWIASGSVCAIAVPTFTEV